MRPANSPLLTREDPGRVAEISARLSLPSWIIKQLLFDPVMAAEVLMGWKLDLFQRVRLRKYWWTPMTVDSSGVSTGKTATQFVFACLRCMLIPNHDVGVYLPNFQVGKDEWWKLFKDTIDRHPFFAKQLKLDRGRLGERKGQGSWTIEWKNGSRVVLPAPNWIGDSKNQASRNFNDVIIDEWLKALEMGSGLQEQVLDRARRASWNKNHPLWANHIILLGHAETPSHKGYATLKAYKRERRDGSARYALVSFCYKDWTPKFGHLLPEEIIRQRKITLTKDQFRRLWLGLWGSDGEGCYPPVFLSRCKRLDLKPWTQRERPEDYYFLGNDVAPGRGVKSDFAANSVLRARRVPGPAQATFAYNNTYWDLAYPYARALRGRTAPQLSGWFYQLHQAFGFSWVVMDAGGGGTWVYDAMQETEQQVDGQPLLVTPVCERVDPMQAQKQPILTFFKRKSEFELITNRQFLTSDEGLVDSAHRRYQQAWVGQQILVPADIDDRAPGEVTLWTPAEREVSRGLQRMRDELENVRVKVDKDGNKLTSSRGFTMYESRKKKDVAYTGMYAFHAFLIWLALHWTDDGDSGDSEAVCG